MRMCVLVEAMLVSMLRGGPGPGSDDVFLSLSLSLFLTILLLPLYHFYKPVVPRRFHPNLANKAETTKK